MVGNAINHGAIQVVLAQLLPIQPKMLCGLRTSMSTSICAKQATNIKNPKSIIFADGAFLFDL
jgi:hypothetical protein